MVLATNASQQLIDEYEKNERLYKSFLAEIEHQVKSILDASGITVNAVTSRLKSKSSLRGKIERKAEKYKSISNITDIVGIRIITYFSEDVDKISQIIETEFDVDQENSIDKRESLEPDRFGYCSVHYVVKMSPQRLKLKECVAFKGLKCEIQIRSILQHAWAEIEHDIGYKSEITVPKEMRRNFSRIAGLLEIADKEFNEIRSSLSEYANSASRKIGTEEFLNHEIDAVILTTIAAQNDNILRLTKHLENLFEQELDEIDNQEAESIIKGLNWFNITTVEELSKAISEYTDFAIDVASEILKNYKSDDESSLNKSVAFFYLRYAILLREYCDIEKIEKYLEDLNIGIDISKREIANELYQIGIRLNGKFN